MNVADLNPDDNPNSPTNETPELLCLQIDQFAQTLKTKVHQAARSGDSFDSIEREIHKMILSVGRQAVDLFVRLQGDGDLGEELSTQDGVTLHRSPSKAMSTIRSIFGTHCFEQFIYAPGPKKAIALRPISARMSLPASSWSYLLQQWTQMLCVDAAYEQAMDNLQVILGGEKLSIDTAYLGDLPKPAADSESKLMVATADCKGVPLVKEDAAKVAAFETAKKNPGNRRMATVASVYTVDPHVRTAEEITEALFRDEPDTAASKPKRPAPANKITTAHMPEMVDDGDGSELRISGIHVAMAWMLGQITQRRRAEQVLIVLMDGQESLWETMKLHLSFGPGTVPILDIVHALAYLWEAAGLFEKDEDRRRAFTRARLLRILRGESQGVIKGLRRLGTTRELKGEAAKDLARICGYLEKHSDRMERSGMRWTLEGARSMLHVRAAFQSDYWESFLADRMSGETQRTHPHRDLLNAYQPTALAC